MKKLHALIEEDNYDWLTDYADAESISLAEAVRLAISSFRYRTSKRQDLAQADKTEVFGHLDGPTEEEDSREGLAKRLRNVEYVLFGLYRNSVPSQVPSADLYKYMPDYLKL